MADRWLLCDYGEVLCVAPPADDWAALASVVVEAGWDPGGSEPAEALRDPYWADRLAYDRGDLTGSEYWAGLLGRVPDGATEERLFAADRAIWLHPNLGSLAAAARAAERGYRLAVFSNAPVEVADAIDSLPWLEPFEPRFFSCRLRAVKPEPEAYRAVLAELGAQPEDVVFFDDRPRNVAGALELGIEAHLFEEPGQIDAV